MPNKILLTTSRYHRVHVLNALYALRAKALRLHQEIGAHWLHTFRPNSFVKAPPHTWRLAVTFCMGFRYDYVSMYIFEHGPMHYTCYVCLSQLDDFSTYKAIHDFISFHNFTIFKEILIKNCSRCIFFIFFAIVRIKYSDEF